MKPTHTLPTDVARCPGYWAEGEMREGCPDCQRRTSPPGDAEPMEPPLIVTFECEARIAPGE